MMVVVKIIIVLLQDRMLLIFMLDHQEQRSERLGAILARETLVSQQKMIAVVLRIVKFSFAFHAFYR